ncbi:hypothetical protein [Mycolicibacterium thermoresistibile]|uniref:Transmembrane protein n=2 Tax=Mycolicibacterium thermoresistibile TaxID=1797 RepID=G7CDQ7_MYCT3|nr:hypothetical protein [Mycolicibacterium thermoresistibile]EHI14081.1 hypothetical protein KEK_05557 [Mycolicibacterium thermoresistibile ATCC 19527]MCV7189463.1 hypothetical protein [Mycolicibacterium thermoresistibile]GAT15131.1 putative uncharacterized protein [Mycolicibacterium thermoresistibile]SNW16320.1 Uncharacterised protein [Mycolicibacterium thermoresistibile]
MVVLRRFSITILAIAFLVCFGWAVHAFRNGHHVTMIVALALAALWFPALIAWVIKPKVKPRAAADHNGTVIRIDWRVDAGLYVCLTAGTLAFGSFSILGVTGRLNIPLPEDIGRHYAAIFFLPAVVCLVLLLRMVYCRGAGYVRLTPDGFTFVESFRIRSGDWSDVVHITDEALEYPGARSPIAVVTADRQMHVLKESAWFTPGGRALLELMRFYWQHPQARLELTDDRALARLEQLHLELGPGVQAAHENPPPPG